MCTHVQSFFECYPSSFNQLNELLLEGTAGMNVMPYNASMVLVGEVMFVPVKVKWLQRC